MLLKKLNVSFYSDDAKRRHEEGGRVTNASSQRGKTKSSSGLNIMCKQRNLIERRVVHAGAIQF